MRVKITGVHPTTKTLADGTRRKYYYLGKGGPRLHGEPGSPEFLAGMHAAKESLKPQPANDIRSLLDGYRSSRKFKTRATSTRRDYERYLKAIDAKFGGLPLIALGDSRTRGVLTDWRDDLAEGSPRAADYTFQVFAAVLAWGIDKGRISHHPLKGIGRTYASTRRDNIWSREQEALFLDGAPQQLRLPLMLALWTGQRQADLIKMLWDDYDGTHIRVYQLKTKARPLIKVGAPLKAALDLEKVAGVERAKGKGKAPPKTILISTRGTAWKLGASGASGFRSSWGRAIEDLEIAGLTFHDIRGTAVTRLAEVGCSVPQICAITGHSLKAAEDILQKHYISASQKLSDSAIEKLENAESSKPDSKPSPNAVSLQNEEAL